MGEAPGRTGEPNSSAPDTAYAVQAAIFRLAPVPHTRSTLLIPPGDLLVVHWPSLPPPTLGKRRHRFLARRRVAVGRRALLVVDESERPQPWLADRRCHRLHDTDRPRRRRSTSKSSFHAADRARGVTQSSARAS